jgi:hypothetical protein
MGMRGTGSEDIAVTDIFVPDRLTFPLVPERDPGHPSDGGSAKRVNG